MLQILYMDAPDLISTKSIYTDADLTIKAPDGFYREGTNYREMVNGELLQAQPCPSCLEPEPEPEPEPPAGTYTFYLSAGVVESDGHCSENFVASTAVYTSDGDGSLNSLLNAKLYSDVDLTNQFDGINLYYFVSLTSGDQTDLNAVFKVVQINNTGDVINQIDQDCSGGAPN